MPARIRHREPKKKKCGEAKTGEEKERRENKGVGEHDPGSKKQEQEQEE
jgi:hypothetical protein